MKIFFLLLVTFTFLSCKKREVLSIEPGSRYEGNGFIIYEKPVSGSEYQLFFFPCKNNSIKGKCVLENKQIGNGLSFNLGSFYCIQLFRGKESIVVSSEKIYSGSEVVKRKIHIVPVYIEFKEGSTRKQAEHRWGAVFESDSVNITKKVFFSSKMVIDTLVVLPK